MSLVPWGSDPEIAEKHRVVGSLADRFGDAQRHLQSLIENLQSEIGLPGWQNWQTR